MSWTQSQPDEPPHDVLAAEAFAVPAPDPTLHHDPVVLPEDPLGLDEPHDVLAAEEFAMPAVRADTRAGALTQTAQDSWRLGLAVLAGALMLFALARLRRR